MSESQRIKELEDKVENLRRLLERMSQQATKGFADMDQRIKVLEGLADI